MAQKIDEARGKLIAAGKSFIYANNEGCLGKLNIRTITTSCSMALGTFYRYFDSKEDFVYKIIEDEWIRIIAEMDNIVKTDLPLYIKVKFIYELLTSFQLNYQYSFSGKNNVYVELQSENEIKMYEIIKEFIETEVARGEIELEAKPESAAYLLVQLFVITGLSSKITFDELWKCMNFKDKSKVD